MRTVQLFSEMTAEQESLPEPATLNREYEVTGNRWKAWTLACVLFLAAALLFQWLGGAYFSEFAGYPDEGAHYITGLMVRDYVAHGHWQSPRTFGEQYYLHYPKVALGHWPPFFYMVEAAWTLVFPISRFSMLFLMALITTTLAFLLYRAIEDEYGLLMGLAAGMLLVALPVIQQYGGMVMADTLVGLLGLAATISFANFMNSNRRSDAIQFGLLASMMILTKGTGLALALVPPLALLLTGRWNVMRRLNFWLPVFVVVPLCGPWYWITRHMLPDTWEEPQPGVHFAIRALRFYAWDSIRVFGFAIVAVAVLGFVTKIVMPPRQVTSKWAALASLALATGLLACIVPAGLEDRFLVPAVPAILAFLIAGADFIARRLFPDRLTLRRRQLAIVFAVIIIFLATTFSIPRGVSSGFAAIAKDIISQPALSKAVVLISSDVIGDGMFISEMAMRERRPGHYVLRGTKVLCDCSWTGTQQVALYPTPKALMDFLDQTPVQIVVDDLSVAPSNRMEFNNVLKDTIQSYSSRWQLLGSFPITRKGIVYPQGARVYKLLGTNPNAPLEIDLHRMLNKKIELRPR